MPTYDYECDACSKTWELFQKITDDPIKKCPECGKKKARRLFGTGAALMFKGSGFYETDYRSDKYKKSAKADSDSNSSSSETSASTDSGSSSKSDTSSKPESKPSESKSSKPESKSKKDKK